MKDFKGCWNEFKIMKKKFFCKDKSLGRCTKGVLRDLRKKLAKVH